MAIRSRSPAPRAAISLVVAVMALAVVVAMGDEPVRRSRAADSATPTAEPAPSGGPSPSPVADLPATSTSPPATPRLCDGFHTVTADVDGDGLPDDVWHAFVGQSAVFVGVCTGQLLDDAIPGVGMSEVLAVGDLNADGREEILFGASGVSSISYHVAVIVNPNGPLFGPRLIEVTKRVRYGEPLELSAGEEPNGPALAFGCEVADGSGPVVTQVTVSVADKSLRWVRKSYRLRGALAFLVARESGTLEGRKPRAQHAQDLIQPCALRLD